jgi:pimeloyl-ACP methyl ester carboxylesterase
VGAQCWPDETPLSAQAYLSVCVSGSNADIYGEREGGALLGRVAKPMLIVYGSSDIGITDVDGTIGVWQARAEKVINPSTSIAIIKGASHSFKNYEPELSRLICDFVE